MSKLHPKLSSQLSSPSPTDALVILKKALHDVGMCAERAGIDVMVINSLPVEGGLLKGKDVPVIHKKYRGTCSVLFHINKTEQGEYWPYIKFSTFKHGGIDEIFNGLTWLNNQNNRKQVPRKKVKATHDQIAPLNDFVTNNCAATAKSQFTIKVAGVQHKYLSVEAENKVKEKRFKQLNHEYQRAKALTRSDVWLLTKLSGYVTPTLLDRLQIKRLHNDIYIPLTNSNSEHTGFHKIVNMGHYDKKFHFSKAANIFKGSFILIEPIENSLTLPIALCEGVATGLSIALVWPGEIRIGLSANNLNAVRNNINGRVVVFYDNDVWKPKVGNVGKKAALAALSPGDHILGPAFDYSVIDAKPTDFNDLLCLQGVEALHKQILPLLSLYANNV